MLKDTFIFRWRQLNVIGFCWVTAACVPSKSWHSIKLWFIMQKLSLPRTLTHSNRGKLIIKLKCRIKIFRFRCKTQKCTFAALAVIVKRQVAQAAFNNLYRRPPYFNSLPPVLDVTHLSKLQFLHSISPKPVKYMYLEWNHENVTSCSNSLIR